MDEPTLITQPPGYPQECPETDDMDGMLEHLACELEGKQLLEKPRVSKKVPGITGHVVLACKSSRMYVGRPLAVMPTRTMPEGE